MQVLKQTPNQMHEAPSSFRARQDARQRHEREYEVTVNTLGLPEHVAFQATPELVHVFATDMNVLAAWLYEQGGTVTVDDLPSGVSVWTLRTQALTDAVVAGESTCPVLVSVTQVTGEPVMHEIRAAVAS